MYYTMDWIQPAEHHDATASLLLLGMALSGTMLLSFYAMDRADLHFPVLNAFGKNLILMFILGDLLLARINNSFPVERLAGAPYLTVTVVALFPIVALGALAVYLEGKKIAIRL